MWIEGLVFGLAVLYLGWGLAQTLLGFMLGLGPDSVWDVPAWVVRWPWVLQGLVDEGWFD